MQEAMFVMAKKIGYTLNPIRPSDGGFMTAALMTCMVTGKMLSSSGGGTYAIAPEVFDLLRDDAEVQELIKRKIDLLDAHPTA